MILDPLTGGILATGWSENCAQTLFEISRDPWDGRERAYPFFSELKPLPGHNLRERENDLIGNFY